MSLLLPCNVVVEDVGARDEGLGRGRRSVSVDDPAFADLVSEVSTRLQHAVDAVVEAAGDPAGTSQA